MTKTLPIYPPTTYVSDDDELFRRDESYYDQPLPPVVTYSTITELPVPLRHTLQRAYETGLTITDLATVYDLPVSWVEFLVTPPKNNSPA